MTYVLECLQLGTDDLRVPESPDLYLENGKVPTQAKRSILTPPGVWNLVFAVSDGILYPASASIPKPKAPGHEGSRLLFHSLPVVKSWYVLEGPPAAPTLAVVPFVIDEDNQSVFGRAINFLDSKPPTSNGVLSTLQHAATATVHRTLPEYSNFQTSVHSSNQEIVITTRVTTATFQELFVPSGPSATVTVNDNTISVSQGNNGYALAIFKKTTNVSVKVIPTLLRSVIPPTEWPMYISRIIEEVLSNKEGELYARLDASTLAGLERDHVDRALAAIDGHVSQLTRTRHVIAGLVGRH